MGKFNYYYKILNNSKLAWWGERGSLLLVTNSFKTSLPRRCVPQVTFII